MPSNLDAQQTIQKLIHIVGKQHVLTDDNDTRLYRQGRRYGSGQVLAVVVPGSLLEQWQVLQAAVDADCIVIMQAANTGLTGGSTPFGDDYDRPVILINTRRLVGIQVINDAKQVVCLPGATLDKLEKELAVFNREPHSVIGSSCIGASVLGGVCNNSGGALVRRGPAYTELALYARVNESGQLELVNHLGIQLGSTPEEILSNLENQQYQLTDIENDQHCCASDHRYAHDVTQVDENTPARFNADPSRLYEASGSAGKVCVFAVRLDTFEKIPSQVFYVGTNTQQDLTAIRRFLLTDLPRLPIAGEYIHRVAYDIGAEYGKDTFMFIEKFGTAKVPAAFAMKDKLDGYLEKIGMKGLSDKVLQMLSKFLPSHLPKRMNEFRDLYEHHLVLRIENQDVEQVQQFLQHYFSANTTGNYFLCTEEEGRKAFLHRFAVAGAAIRYRDTHRSEVEDIVALDIALRRNDREWVETLPKEMDELIIHKLYYGHFLCHVFHQDYIVKKGVDPLAIEHQMWSLLDARGAEYPAEHNVGHLYVAKPALKKHYQKLDPTNSFNVGIGHTSKLKYWNQETN
ncbi:D-lactate dehydrogenase [Acinetobacter sp. C_4_1]|uniref:D-lactate dehydrogenase n=1 Tax=unclassified Acinetobacter TaxID=196816 RepID=UPI0021B7ACAD|nr:MULTISPECIES: D-lactate dehydrogenase [unclassified Acinetobacter]MCT8088899.1 D-lactate dehydrogenase [Acinetobacter sp. F_3_1]MCT8097055.1 D-lactate dehydrogenase [Acinetobacter sp. C_3_1]MCT8099952.1 D-lactate dehydrogenase [Acinetobacter sp. C_4_1]MCT8134350.1 D-lactate dehydrogenase [Acinetobacter sp. T_3_1]